MGKRTILIAMAACLFLVAADAAPQGPYWNQFRGPTGDGVSRTQNLPIHFDDTTNLRWKTPIHDLGWSSPVVWGDQIWLTTAQDDGTKFFAICVDLKSGDIIHDIKVFDEAQPQGTFQRNNTHASPTPIVEEGRVYVHFGAYGTACLDTKTGEKLWENRELKCKHGVLPGSSPILDGDNLILTYDGEDYQYVTALDKHTGEVSWLTLRDGSPALGESPEQVEREKSADQYKSFATPLIIEYQGKKQLISPGAWTTYSYDPDTGEEIWRMRHEGPAWNLQCRPVFAHGLVFYTTGIAHRLVAVRPDGTGDVTDTHLVWEADRAPKIPSPVIVDDLLFMVNGSGGRVTCIEAKTGERVWRERLPAGGAYWGSPVYADGRIYFANTRGVVSVIAATREFQLLAENRFNLEGLPQEGSLDPEALNTGKIFGGGRTQRGFIASPAIAGDAIILRTDTHLYCMANLSGADGQESSGASAAGTVTAKQIMAFYDANGDGKISSGLTL